MLTKDEEGGSLDIDTKVHGNPGQLHQLAQELKQHANHFADSAADVSNSQAEADMAWAGKAADACHDYLGNGMTFGQTMAGSLDLAAPAVEELADGLDTAQRRLHRALDVAHRGGLQVTGTVIHFPNEAAPIPPEGTDISAQQDYFMDKAGYDQRQNAWNQVVQINTDARGIERAAHDKFKNALSKSHYDIAALTRILGQAVGYTLTFAGGVNGTTAAFAADATLKRGLANAAQQAIQNNPNRATRAELGAVMQSLKEADNAEGNARLWGKYAKLFPDKLKKLAGTNLGNLSREIDSLKVARKVPVAGTILAAMNAETAIAQGKDPAKEWAKVGVNTVEGAAAAELFALAIPGPGWAYAAGAAAAFPLTHVTNEVIDNWDKVDDISYEDVQETMDDESYNTGINQWHSHR